MTEEKKDPECPPYLRARSEIEEEIRNRQAKWRVKQRVEEVRSGKRMRQEKPERGVEPSGGVTAVEPQPDEPPPGTHYKSKH